MDFAFAFNCLPTAGSTLVFAAAYRPSDELKSLLSAGLALGKLLGFPLLFLSAAIFKTKDVHDVLVTCKASRQNLQATKVARKFPVTIEIMKWGLEILRHSITLEVYHHQ